MTKCGKYERWIRGFAVFLLAGLLLLTAACGNGGSNANTNGANGDKVTNAAKTNNGANAGSNAAATNDASGNDTAQGAQNEPAATVYPLKTTDASGTELTFEAAPQRIVTLVPSETEIVFALGAGDAVVGVDNNSNYPPEAASKEKVGDMDANIEKIVSLKPDLVLASVGMSQPVVDKLRSLKLNVYASDPKTYEQVMDKITRLGQILNKPKEAAAVTGHMQDVLKQVRDAVKDAPKPKVFLEFSPGWTVGKGEFLDELVTFAGGTNIADKTGWYEIDPEMVVKTNPDVILYSSIPVKKGEKNPILAGIESRPGWDAINAVKDNKVFELQADPLVRVGPRLAEGLLDMAKKLHPDAVK